MVQPEVKVGDWWASEDCSFSFQALPCQHCHIHSVSSCFWNICFCQLLVVGHTKLIFCFHVHPQLGNPAFLVAMRNFRMNNPLPRSHPLEVPFSDYPLVAKEIFMLDCTSQHVGHCFKAPVRVVKEASRTLNSTFVKQEKWV